MPGRRTDEELMREAGGGSADAFDRIVRRHQGAVLRLFMMMVGDRETARDLTQECFLKLLRSAPRYEVKAKFTTFLYTIARRLAFDEKAKAWNRREPMEREFASPADGPDHAYEKKETALRLAAALAKLPDPEREALVLSEAGGMRYADIAKIAGCPEGTVASRKNRAVRMLRKTWKDGDR